MKLKAYAEFVNQLVEEGYGKLDVVFIRNPDLGTAHQVKNKPEALFMDNRLELSTPLEAGQPANVVCIN